MKIGILLTIVALFGFGSAPLCAEDYHQGPSGGSGGEPFEDGNLPEGARVSEVRVWAGGAVDAIQFVLEAAGQFYELPKHGGGGGTINVFTLLSDELLTGISGLYNGRIGQIRFHTSSGRSSAPYGRGGKAEFSFEAPAGGQIVGLFGRAGGMVDALGAITRDP